MAFKSMKDYNEEKFGGLFLLRNDRDYADVIFLYPSVDDVLVADTHYVKSADYSGYVHCCGKGCPACAKGIRVQTKLFIPLYNIKDNEIQFWDRSIRFENQLNSDVFEKFANPSEYVFRITRNGVAGDVNTTYSITAVGTNNVMKMSDILAAHNAKFPDYYENICKSKSIADLSIMLSSPETPSTPTESSAMPSYQVTPRIPATQPIPLPTDADVENFSTVEDAEDFATADDVDDPQF